jgi:signal transduction histidine kinase
MKAESTGSREAAGEAIRKPVGNSATKGTILVVEDEPELSEILEFNLRRNEYRVHTAGDGLTACRLIAEKRPDLILLDILLPDLDGWEICRQVRLHPDPVVASTPIIMLTALGTLDYRLKGLELGADAYFPKPYSVKEVLLSVGSLIARARRTAVLSRELETLRAGARLQGDIQGMLFHELRNQLVVVGGYTRLLQQEEKTSAGGPSKEYMETVSRSSEHLARLAEEMLRAGRLSTGTLSLTVAALDPIRIMKDVAALLKPLARQKGAQVEIQGPGCSAMANESGLRLVLSILLENALKYGGKGNVVRLRTIMQTGGVRLEVADSGPGIPPEETTHIFEKHYRGKTTADESPGSGMGLHIARTLAVVMEGDLEVRSRPGEGSCFTLCLRSDPSKTSALAQS